MSRTIQPHPCQDRRSVMRISGLLVAAVPLGLTVLLVFAIFVPVVPSQGGGSMTECSPHGCITDIAQYESVSYAYGGWGAIFQTGVNWYFANGWVCSCPAETAGHVVQCCVPPFAGVVWPAMGLLALADLVSLAVIALNLTRFRSAGRPAKSFEAEKYENPASSRLSCSAAPAALATR